MKQLLLVLVVGVLGGCVTVEDKIQEKYGAPLKEFSYDGDSYKVAVNEKNKEIFVKENESILQKSVSIKYGLAGIALDAANVLGREEKYRGLADKYLSVFNPGCRTNSTPADKLQMECYEFKFDCQNKEK